MTTKRARWRIWSLVGPMQKMLIMMVTGWFLSTIVGCGPKEDSADSGKGANLPPTLQTFRAEIEKGKAQIDLTLGALSSLVKNADANPRPDYDEFLKQLMALDAQAAAIRSRADDMRARGKTYFAAWEKQLSSIQSKALQELAAKRREELTKDYEEVTQATTAAKEAYQPFVADLKDMQKVLANDLNAAGIKSLSAKITKAAADGKTVKERASVVVKTLEDIASIYASGK